MVWFVASQVGVLCLSVALLVAGYRNASWVVAVPGEGAVMLVTLIWVVAVDSLQRWPGTTWTQRLGRVMTFYRD